MIEYENLKNTNSTYFKELEKAATNVIKGGWYVLGEEVNLFEVETIEGVWFSRRPFWTLTLEMST